MAAKGAQCEARATNIMDINIEKASYRLCLAGNIPANPRFRTAVSMVSTPESGTYARIFLQQHRR
jgi:hypothetical protein